MTSPDADPNVAHHAFDVESGGAGTDGHFLTARPRDGALAALVLDRDLAHGGASGDLHAGLLVEAEPDRTHLAADLARAGVDAAAGGAAAGLSHDVERATEIVDDAAARLHLGRDGPVHAVYPKAARLHTGVERKIRIHADLQAAAALEVETIDLDPASGHAEREGVLLLEGNVLDDQRAAVDARPVRALGDGCGHSGVGHDLRAAELRKDLHRPGGRRGWGGGVAEARRGGGRGGRRLSLGSQGVEAGGALLGGDGSGAHLVQDFTLLFVHASN